MHILLVEDDMVLGDGLQTGLTMEGHVVDWLHDGLDAKAAVMGSDFDAVVLDLGLPGCDGRTVLRQWRKDGVDTPVLVLTAFDQAANCVETLDIGADDFVTKPITLPELSARLRAIQRRAAGDADNRLRLGKLVMDRENRTMTLSDQPIELSTYEYIILEALMDRAGRPVERETLEVRLYGWEDGPESNSLEVLIHNLRGKIGRDRIKTIRNVGYQFNA